MSDSSCCWGKYNVRYNYYYSCLCCQEEVVETAIIKDEGGAAVIAEDVKESILVEVGKASPGTVEE
jgi:hypothetical protein